MTSLPPALYRDPINDGAADPTVIWNPHEKAWWMFYTSRRATDPQNGVGWVHGTAIGIASSEDRGRTWLYRGDLEDLRAPGDWGHNTYWAPEVVEVDGVFHLFVSYIVGVPTEWAGHPRTIRHYSSSDLRTWRFRSTLELSSDRVIDACVHALPAGGYRLWYKDEADGNTIWAADSADLDDWTVVGQQIAADVPLEGPYVFELDGQYWMLVDAKCQRIYRSDDLTSWEHTTTVLETSSGIDTGRIDDTGPGLHAQVVVAGETAWTFYFTHPDRHRPDLQSADMRRSSIHVAALQSAGNTLVCDRSASVEIDLAAAEPEAGR